MAKMKLGSKEINTPGPFSKTDTVNYKKLAEKKYPGYKAYDSKTTPGALSMKKGSSSFTYNPGKRN